MKSVICSLFLATGFFSNLSVQASEQPLNAFDMAQLLMQNQGQLDDSTLMALLSQGIEANIRIEPEHLGVAFWDSRTGERVNPQEIRELIGPVRQDGTWQVLDMALSLGGERLLLDQEQLRLLMDAAFMASMRRPPQHISIEYYDRRQGPTGEGGGVSGSVPDETQTMASEPEPVAQAQPSGRPDSLPPSEDALLAAFSKLGFTAEERTGLYLFPIVTWALDAEQLEAKFEQDLMELHSLGLSLQQLTDDPVIKEDGDWLVLYALGYFEANEHMTGSELEDTRTIHRLILEQVSAD
ncbi:hypothetical protein CWE09_07365 [Aliidiomarina minuta]|uniref:DUF2066 domain-containing protein n=1 Tax=Aliidiomarina minuta TaxID=880057 RepID=A0A432W8P5_9GAMM|nr:hypothetical protein [Aliidiomarina minuta]RUO26517.1 hypothetical protein CWE09_07365 [Aliidiomarina minuta]